MRLFAQLPKLLRKWYLSYSQWSHNLFALFALGLAICISWLARILPPRAQQSALASTKLLRNFARIIRKPRYVELWLDWRIFAKAMIDSFLLTIPLFLFDNLLPTLLESKQSTLLVVSIGLLLFCMFLITFIFYLLASIVFVSGDAYGSEHDEFQASAANETGMFTLRFVVILIVLLCLVYQFLLPWRASVVVHLLLLLFAARLTYIIKLLQLRWQDLTEADIEDEEDGPSPRLRIVKHE